MKSWQTDLLVIAEKVQNKYCEKEFFVYLLDAAKELGFEYCAYGLRTPLPLTNPKTVLLNNYQTEWQRRYADAAYVNSDPSVQYCRKVSSPLIWSDRVFLAAPELWDEARSFGLRYGWAQSSFDGNGMGGMLTLARSSEPLSGAELHNNEIKMRWIVNIAHQALSRALLPEQHVETNLLTVRETEILKWTADGKTSSEISELLLISENTVNFHVKNIVLKLKVANKTAAVVKAAVMGMLG